MHKAIGLFSNTVAVQIYTAEGKNRRGLGFVICVNICHAFSLIFPFFPLLGLCSARFSFRTFMINSVRIFSSASQSCKVVIWIFFGLLQQQVVPLRCKHTQNDWWRFIRLQIGESRLHKLLNINFAHYAFNLWECFGYTLIWVKLKLKSGPPFGTPKSLFKVASHIYIFFCICKSICKYTSKFRKCGNASQIAENNLVKLWMIFSWVLCVDS